MEANKIIGGGDPYKMTNIKFVRGCSNFAQFSTILKMQVAKIWNLKKKITILKIY